MKSTGIDLLSRVVLAARAEEGRVARFPITPTDRELWGFEARPVVRLSEKLLAFCVSKYRLTSDRSPGFRLCLDDENGYQGLSRLSQSVASLGRQALIWKPCVTTSAADCWQNRLGAEELGFSLGEIRELLSLRVSRTAKSADVRKRAEAKIVDIDAKIKTLDSMKRTLRKLTNACEGCGPVAECLILESLDKEQA